MLKPPSQMLQRVLAGKWQGLVLTERVPGMDATLLNTGVIDNNQIPLLHLDAAHITTGELTLADTDGAASIHTADKTSYADTDAGIWIGMDSATGKFNIGDATKYIQWDGSILTVQGMIRTGPNDAQRMVLDNTDNTFKFYDTTNEVVMFLDDSSVATGCPELAMYSDVGGNGGRIFLSRSVDDQIILQTNKTVGPYGDRTTFKIASTNSGGTSIVNIVGGDAYVGNLLWTNGKDGDMLVNEDGDLSMDGILTLRSASAEILAHDGVSTYQSLILDAADFAFQISNTSKMTLDTSGNLALASGNLTLTLGNIVLSAVGATVDGVDISAHDADVTTKHLPAQATHSGKFLTTNGSVAAWELLGTDDIPDLGGTYLEMVGHAESNVFVTLDDYGNITKSIATTYYAQASHNHAGTDINSGTVGFSYLPVGTGATQVAAGDHGHAHSSLSGIGANDHHNQSHVLDGGDHTVSGLTGGYFLKATSATTFGFAAHGLSAGDVGAISGSGHTGDSFMITDSYGNFTTTALTGYSASGHNHTGVYDPAGTAAALTYADVGAEPTLPAHDASDAGKVLTVNGSGGLYWN